MTANSATRSLTEAPTASQEVQKLPTRYQRSRTKGYRMPAGVYVGRGSKWGNPFTIKVSPKGMVGAYPQTPNRYAVIDTRPDAPRGNYKLFPTFHDAARYAVSQYRYVVLSRILADDPTALQELAGKNLICWCTETNPCHGDVLLERANNLDAQ